MCFLKKKTIESEVDTVQTLQNQRQAVLIITYVLFSSSIRRDWVLIEYTHLDQREEETFSPLIGPS